MCCSYILHHFEEAHREITSRAVQRSMLNFVNTFTVLCEVSVTLVVNWFMKVKCTLNAWTSISKRGCVSSDSCPQSHDLLLHHGESLNDNCTEGSCVYIMIVSERQANCPCSAALLSWCFLSALSCECCDELEMHQIMSAVGHPCAWRCSPAPEGIEVCLV